MLKPAPLVASEAMVLTLPLASMVTKVVSVAWSCRVRMLPVPVCSMKRAAPVELLIETLPVKEGLARLAFRSSADCKLALPDTAPVMSAKATEVAGVTPPTLTTQAV
jgi:hypothetical protein